MAKLEDGEPNGERFARAESVAWQRIGTELVLLDIPRRTLLGLNSAAAHLWEALVCGDELGTSAAELASRRDQPRPIVREQASRLVDELLARGLLVACGAARAASTTQETSGQAAPGDGVVAADPGGDDAYEAPAISWEEPLEQAGVYAACAKDPGGDIDPNCTSAPNFASS